MNRKVIFTIFLALIFSITACKKDEDVDTKGEFDTSEDGNIVIENHSNHALALYHNGVCIKKIPNSSTDFSIWLPNPSDQTFDLQIYKYDDVSDDFSKTPDITNIYKRWSINLSNSKEIEKRVTWHITSSSAEINSGTLKFSYVGGTDLQVDVFINNKNGAKIITLKPGDQYENIVGIDYGAYTMHYRYWISDPNTGESSEIKGWLEKEMVAGAEVNIWNVINTNRPEAHLFIPHFNNNGDNDKWGIIKITNQYPVPIVISANGVNIEKLIYLDGNTQAASILQYGDAIEFILDSDEYLLEARTLTSSTVLARANINLGKGKDAKVTWKIFVDDDGNVDSEITGANQ